MRKMLLLSKGKKIRTLVDPWHEKDWRSKYLSLEGESLELPEPVEPPHQNKVVSLSRTGIPLENNRPIPKKKPGPKKKHVVTEKDMEINPDLKESGVKAGDEVELGEPAEKPAKKKPGPKPKKQEDKPEEKPEKKKPGPKPKNSK